MSRAQRSAVAAIEICRVFDPRCAADPGPFRYVAVPDQRCTTSALLLML